MKHRLLSVRMIAYLFLGLCCLELAGQSASAWRESFDRGLMQEDIHDNPEQAIEHYRSVVAAFDEERDLIAMSIYRLAECLRKTENLEEALPLYQRIVKEFGDRESLALLSRRFVPEDDQDVGTLLIDDPELLRTLLGQLENASPVIALQSLAQLTGDLTAASLIERHLQCEEKVVALSTRYRDGWPPLREERARLEAIKGQMERHIGGAINSLEAQLVRLEGVASVRGNSSPEVKKFADDLVTLRLLIDELKQANEDVALQLLSRELSSTVAARLQEERIAIQLEISGNLDDYGPEHPKIKGARNRLTSVNELVADHIRLETEQLEAKLRILEKAMARFPSVDEVRKMGVIKKDLADPEAIRLAELQRIAIEKPDLLMADTEGQLPPLHRAVRAGQKKVVRFLLDSGIDINSRNEVGKSPLHSAVEKGDLGMTELLLAEEKCDVNAKEPFHSTPLHVAVEKGFYALAKVLLEAGADVDARSLQRSEIRYGGVVRRIERSRRLSFQFPLNNELDQLNHDFRELKAVYPYLLTEGNTPLHLSTVAGFNRLTELLLSHEAAVNVTNRCGLTPLLQYLGHSHSPLGVMKKTVQLLVDHGADVTLSGVMMIPNPDRTPTGHAARPTYFDALDRSSGAVPRFFFGKLSPWRDSLVPQPRLPIGWTSPIHLALVMDDEMAGLLVEHGADFAQRDYRGWTPLHVLASLRRESEYWERLRLLGGSTSHDAEVDERLFPGLNPLETDWGGFRAVDYALEIEGNYAAAIALGRLVPEESVVDYSFQTFWHAIMGHPRIHEAHVLSTLVNIAEPAGDVFNTLGPGNSSPLEYVLLQRQPPVVAKWLLKNGAEPVLMTSRLIEMRQRLATIVERPGHDDEWEKEFLKILLQLKVRDSHE